LAGGTGALAGAFPGQVHSAIFIPFRRILKLSKYNESCQSPYEKTDGDSNVQPKK
jgi:hypothetical protein